MRGLLLWTSLEQTFSKEEDFQSNKCLVTKLTKTKQNKTKQNKTIQNNTKQYKTIQNTK